MITTINQFKLLETSNTIKFKIYNGYEFYEYISKNGPNNTFDTRFLLKNDGGNKAFKYYQYDDFKIEPKNVFFFGLEYNNQLIALAHIRKSPHLQNTYWLSYLCVDPLYEHKGYATILAEYIFKWYKQHGLQFETSSYTEIGYIKLKPLFNRLALKYNVNFIDKEKL